MRTTAYGFEVAMVAALLALAACGGNVVVDSGNGGAGAGGSVGSSGGSCMSDSDCSQGQVCNVNTSTCEDLGSCQSDPNCVSPPTGCVSDADCIPGGVCDNTSGVCMDPPGTSCKQCACVDVLTMGGCADLCNMALSGTSTPNFCDGVPALSQCRACLFDRCASLNIDPTNPSACM